MGYVRYLTDKDFLLSIYYAEKGTVEVNYRGETYMRIFKKPEKFRPDE